jgi:transposase
MKTSKTSENKARKVALLLASGLTIKETAKRAGVSKATVFNMKKDGRANTSEPVKENQPAPNGYEKEITSLKEENTMLRSICMDLIFRLHSKKD